MNYIVKFGKKAPQIHVCASTRQQAINLACSVRDIPKKHVTSARRDIGSLPKNSGYGYASITIELENSCLRVFHGTDKTELFRRPANLLDWKKI